MGPSPRNWATGKDAVPPSVTKGDAPAEPLRDTTGGDDGTATTSGGDAAALFDNDSSTVASLSRQAAVAAVPLHGQPAGDLLHAHLGHGRRRRPERVGGEGLQRRQPLGRARRAQRRDVPLALADAAVQARAARAATPTTGSRSPRAAARLGEVELLNPGKADTSPLVTDVDRVVASAGDTVPVQVTVSNYGEERGERDA